MCVCVCVFTDKVLVMLMLEMFIVYCMEVALDLQYMIYVTKRYKKVAMFEARVSQAK